MNESKLKEYGFELLWELPEDGICCYSNDMYIIIFYAHIPLSRADEIKGHDRWSIAEVQLDWVPYTDEEFDKFMETVQNYNYDYDPRYYG